jgi:hypothetical protein
VPNIVEDVVAPDLGMLSVQQSEVFTGILDAARKAKDVAHNTVRQDAPKYLQFLVALARARPLHVIKLYNN